MIGETSTPTNIGVGGVAGLILAMLVFFGKAGWQGFMAFLKIRKEGDEAKDTRNMSLVRFNQDMFKDINVALNDERLRLHKDLDDANERIDQLVATVAQLTGELQVLRARVRELEKS